MTEQKIFKEFTEKKCKVCENKHTCNEELRRRIDNTVVCMKFKCKNCNKVKECFEKERNNENCN